MRVDMSMEFRPEDMSLLERCPHQRVLCTGFNGVGTQKDVSLLDMCPHLRVCTGFNGVGT